MEETKRKVIVSRIIKKTCQVTIPHENIIEIPLGDDVTEPYLCGVFSTRTEKNSYTIHLYRDGTSQVFIH